MATDNLGDFKAVMESAAISRQERKERMEKENASIPEDIQKEVEAIIEKEFPPENHHFGVCHAIWGRKVELYQERGYRWYPPSVINPYIMYD